MTAISLLHVGKVSRLFVSQCVTVGGLFMIVFDYDMHYDIKPIIIYLCFFCCFF